MTSVNIDKNVPFKTMAKCVQKQGTKIIFSRNQYPSPFSGSEIVRVSVFSVSVFSGPLGFWGFAINVKKKQNAFCDSEVSLLT